MIDETDETTVSQILNHPAFLGVNMPDKLFITLINSHSDSPKFY